MLGHRGWACSSSKVGFPSDCSNLYYVQYCTGDCLAPKACQYMIVSDRNICRFCGYVILSDSRFNLYFCDW